MQNVIFFALSRIVGIYPSIRSSYTTIRESSTRCLLSNFVLRFGQTLTRSTFLSNSVQLFSYINKILERPALDSNLSIEECQSIWRGNFLQVRSISAVMNLCGAGHYHAEI